MAAAWDQISSAEVVEITALSGSSCYCAVAATTKAYDKEAGKENQFSFPVFVIRENVFHKLNIGQRKLEPFVWKKIPF